MHLTYLECCWEIACAYRVWAGGHNTLHRYRYYLAICNA